MPAHRIYFKARNWEFNKGCPDNKGERCFISGIDGQLEEVFIIGSKTGNHTEILSKPMMLEKYNRYSFCFWLKDGESEEGSQIYQLQAIFDGKNDQAYQYKLNQSYIVPIKVVDGWRLYDISFDTQNHSVTQLKFVVEGGIMTIMSAVDPEDYRQLQDDRVLPQKNVQEKAVNHGKRNPLNFGPYTSNKQTLTKNELVANNLYQQIVKKLDEGCVQQRIIDDIVDQLVERIEKEINIERMLKEYSESINGKQLEEEIRNILKEHIRKEL